MFKVNNKNTRMTSLTRYFDTGQRWKILPSVTRGFKVIITYFIKN